jgi:predicted nucleotidyltransferase
MHPIIETRRSELAALCRSRGVRRLELFGSAARDDFDESRSDIDLLVEFGDRSAGHGLSPYFDLKEALEQLFARSVDLVEIGTVRNPYVRAQIDRDRQLLYAA